MNLTRIYCNETLGSNGELKDFSINCPDNFNFGYDVADYIADNEPEKRALVWCNTEGEEHVFTFSDIIKF